MDLLFGWIEPRILLNKAQRWTREALRRIKEKAPMPILSFHSDNDGVFINEKLQAWCAENQISYARGRPYHSNDTEEEVALIAELYENLRLLLNFFYPSAKLVQKVRLGGGRIHRIYDEPKSPFRRLIECEAAPEAVKIELHHRRGQLDPFELKANITRIQDQLIELVKRKNMKVPSTE